MPEDSCKVHLDDGRTVDICTTRGADTYLQSYQSIEFKLFSKNMRDAKKIREKGRRKGRLSAAVKSRLTLLYFMVDSIAQYSSLEIFTSIVPKLEIEEWIEHVIVELKEKSGDKKWAQTGTLEQHDTFLLNPCVSMFRHAIPTQLAFEKGFFKVLSEFVEARKAPLLPCADIADTITLLVGNAITSTLRVFDPIWNAEKTFKKLESCGMLAQFIRCSTVPQQHDAFSVLRAFHELLQCPVLIKKIFKKGEPCSDVVCAILNGTDGSKTKRPIVIGKLKNLTSFVDIMQGSRENDENKKPFSIKMCRYCNKSELSDEFQLSLMACARCQNTFYCSKECQKDDWKVHKKHCKLMTKADTKRVACQEQILMNFVNMHGGKILAEIVEVCNKTGLKKDDLLLELDFLIGENGTAPALKDPPEFKVAEACLYFEGDRPNEPDWFYKGTSDTENYEHAIKNVMSNLKLHFNGKNENHLLCFAQYPGGCSSCKVQLQQPTSGRHMFSNGAVAAVNSLIKSDDNVPFKHYFEPNIAKKIEKELGGMGLIVPSQEMMEEIMEDARSVLQMFERRYE